MLLTITCTPPDGAAWAATDLGFLLHKNPDRVQAFEQSYGTAHVLYPEATAQRCTAALLVEVDPIRLVRGRSRNTPDFSLGQYVNDQPYAASSLLSVAVGAVFRTALHGQCKARPELVQTALPLHVGLPAVPCEGGPEAAERVFAPLGWTVAATSLPLDPAFPEWGDSHYVRLGLTGTIRLSDALSHLYVLLPVLDGAKHYWLAADEVDKLIRAGAGWLAAHPERGWITRRYLARHQSLVRTALARLADVDDTEADDLDAVEKFVDTEATDGELAAHQHDSADGHQQPGTQSTDSTVRTPGPDHTGPEQAAPMGTAEERPESLAKLRRTAVLEVLRQVDAHRVLDLGCGDGALLRDLLADKTFTEIVGVDVSMRALNIAKRKLRLEHMPERVARRLTLRQGALTYTDARLRGYDAAVLMEVVEHVDPPRLGALEHAVFGAAAPEWVLVTTPNAEHNALYKGLRAGTFRHEDHRFEWTRREFAAWAQGIGERYGYGVRFVPIGPEHPEFGSSTQMTVFTKPSDAEGTE